MRIVFLTRYLWPAQVLVAVEIVLGAAAHPQSNFKSASTGQDPSRVMSNLPNPSPQLNACSILRRLCMGTCLLASVAAAPALAQQSSDGQPAKPPAAVTPSAQTDAKRVPETVAPAEQPAVIDPHQAQIIADTQKLVKLSEELKAEVAKSNKDMLSLTVIKKAEEVEKLAKTLKDELSKSH